MRTSNLPSTLLLLPLVLSTSPVHGETWEDVFRKIEAVRAAKEEAAEVARGLGRGLAGPMTDDERERARVALSRATRRVKEAYDQLPEPKSFHRYLHRWSQGTALLRFIWYKAPWSGRFHHLCLTSKGMIRSDHPTVSSRQDVRKEELSAEEVREVQTLIGSLGLKPGGPMADPRPGEVHTGLVVAEDEERKVFTFSGDLPPNVDTLLKALQSKTSLLVDTDQHGREANGKTRGVPAPKEPLPPARPPSRTAP